MMESVSCEYCKKKLDGKFIQSTGKNYHPDCFYGKIAIKCAHCRLPVDNKCIIDFWGNYYHFEHKKNAVSCFYCGRFLSSQLTRGGRKLPDGRAICGLCNESVITEIKRAEKIFFDIKTQLEKMGITFEGYIPELSLVPLSKLGKSGAIPMVEKSGLTKFEGEKIDDKFQFVKISILILDHLPKHAFITTAAHELMHVWQYLNSPFNKHGALSEGSSNMAAYLIHKELRTKKSEYQIKCLLENKDKLYGKGFRSVRSFVKKNGIPEWLKYLKTNSRLPKI